MELNFQINLLKISYLFNFLLLGILLIFNLVYIKSIIWKSSKLNRDFSILIIIFFIPIFSPLIFFIIIIFKKTYKIFFLLLKIGFITTILSIGIAIGILIIYIFIIEEYPLFYRNCPFNYDLSDLEIIFYNFMNNKNINSNNKISELREICENRRCIIQNIFSSDAVDNRYFYICNYDSSEDFKEEKDNEIFCEKFTSKEEFDSKMIMYINLCNSLINFYLCKTKNIPKKYNIESDYVCPSKENKSFALEIIITLLNIVIPFSIYLIEFICCKKIMKLLVSLNINRPANQNNENGGTVDTSRKTDLKNNNSSFKKENTQLIIIDKSSNEDKIFNIYNKDKSLKRKNRNIVNNKAESLLINSTTAKPTSLLNIEIIKNKRKNKNNLKIDIDEKNKSFTNNNNNYLNNNKFELLDSMRVLTEINKNEIIENNKTNNYPKNEDSIIKYIMIKK